MLLRHSMLQIVGMPGRCLRSLPLFTRLWGPMAAEQVLVESRQHSQDTCGDGDGDGDTAVVPTAHSSAPCGLSCHTAPGFTAPHSLVSP